MEENNWTWTIEDPKLTFRTGWKIAKCDDGYCLIKLSVPENYILSDPMMRKDDYLENAALSAGVRFTKVIREYVDLPPKKMKTLENAFLPELQNMDKKLGNCKCRASWAKVEKIISIRSFEEIDHAASCFDPGFAYRKDAVVHYRKEYFDTDMKSPTYLEALVNKYIICGPGIHYFNSWLLAMYYLIVMYCDMQADEFVDRVTKLDEMIQRGDI